MVQNTVEHIYNKKYWAINTEGTEALFDGDVSTVHLVSECLW